MPRGRKYTSEEKQSLIDEILRLIGEEMHTTTKACKAVGVPHMTFVDWTIADAELGVKYARARDACIDAWAEETMEIADSQIPMTQFGSYDSAAVQAKRMQIDTRKWLLSKLNKKKYGDKLELSGDAASPLVPSLDTSQLSTEVLQAILAAKK